MLKNLKISLIKFKYKINVNSSISTLIFVFSRFFQIYLSKNKSVVVNNSG